MRQKSGSLLCGIAAVAIIVVSAPATAQSPATANYDLPEQSVASAIQAIARTSGENVAAPADLLRGRQAAPVKGRFSTDAALSVALSGSGLHAERVEGGYVIREGAAVAGPLDSRADDQEIVVTGTRIRGSVTASTVIRIDREAARNSGQATLGEIARSIPQSFGGGQNPGIGFNVPVTSGVDVGGGSSINLRGLGSDATLTLLNGRRLAYSGSRQAVDVSTIPLDMLDRIEIVADGASALYGSDAVGGVANIILRRDMQGIVTRARIGGATDGGAFQQQYGLTGGARWRTGGFIASFEHNDATAIDASQRSYAATRSRGLRLLPSARSDNGVLSFHQSIAPSLEFALDAMVNRRVSLFIYPQNSAGDLSISRAEQTTVDKAFIIAPALTWNLANGGHLDLSGSFGTDRANYSLLRITPAATTVLTAGCYCNRMLSIELGGNTPLLTLPGGTAKLALGVGIRRTGLASRRGASDPTNYDHSLNSTYGYLEINVPLVQPTNEVAGLSRLNFDAAIRYERYRAFGSVATPKLGVIWSPVPGIDVKASWGRSFRAPTLQQQFQVPIATLFPATVLGGTGLPAGSTGLYLNGGNSALKPERASSWSLGVEFAPRAVPGLRAELGYFSTRYVDRIVAPIGFLTQSLSNPLYAAQITRSPGSALLSSIIARSIFQLSGVATYDPSKVVAIVDNSNVNAGRQLVHGLDGLVKYSLGVGASDTLNLDASATYIVSSRRLTPEQPVIPLAGILFNPPHWRARGSMGWQHGAIGTTITANYTGDLSDTRSTPALRVPGQTTFDLAIRYRTGENSLPILHGLDLIFAVQNAFGTQPPLIATGPVTDTPYDSTNYSAVGRFVSFTIAKKW